MSTVIRRTFASVPVRDAFDTWGAIVELLTRGRQGAAREELMSVAGVASSVIGDRAPKEAPIVITCDGPRTRVYCFFDDDALDGDDTNEDPLGFDPLEGDWAVSLPCRADDLEWVGRALAAKSERITARDLAAGISTSEESDASAATLKLDVAGFLGS